MKILFTLVCLFIIQSCSHTTIPTNHLIASTSDQKLQQLIRTHHQFYLQSSPFNDPKEGGNNGRLPDLSPENLALQNQKLNSIYQELISINNKQLSSKNQINRAVLLYVLKNQLDSYQNKEHYMPLTAESGFHVWISNITQQVHLKSEQDYLDYLSKLRAIPHYFEQQITWMNRGIQENITQPKVVLKGLFGFLSSVVCY